MTSTIEVLVPAATRDLTTLATAKSELGITGSSEDDKIELYIHQASDAIAAYCNRVFGMETVRETFICANFRRELRLKRFPIVSLSSVAQGGSNTDLNEFVVDAEKGILKRKFTYSPLVYSGDIVVTYVSGYDLLGNLPYDIERACLMLVSRAHSGGGEIAGLKSEEIPDVATYTYSDDSANPSHIPPDIAALLNSYKDLCVA